MNHMDFLIMCNHVMCACHPQADPLHMGVSTGGVSSLLRLLFLQRDVVSSAVTPPLLGCPYIKNGL